MNEIRTAYFAGLIDGEGCIGFHSAGKGVVRPIVQINMTHEKTVRAVCDYFDVGTVRPKKVYGNEKPQWRWKCSCQAARKVLQAVAPYLICKRDEADEVLKYSR